MGVLYGIDFLKNFHKFSHIQTTNILSEKRYKRSFKRKRVEKHFTDC